MADSELVDIQSLVKELRHHMQDLRSLYWQQEQIGPKTYEHGEFVGYTTALATVEKSLSDASKERALPTLAEVARPLFRIYCSGRLCPIWVTGETREECAAKAHNAGIRMIEGQPCCRAHYKPTNYLGT